MSSKPETTRIGLYYFPDTMHYRERDLAIWLQEIQSIGVSWLVLNSSLEQAIPEYFLSRLIEAGVTPIIRLQTTLTHTQDFNAFAPIMEAYARWGVRYVMAFDRPNSYTAWGQAGWTQQDLVERYLDRWLPFASLAVKSGLKPVLSPLEPGGSYWDTAFLSTTLRSLIRRKQQDVLRQMVLSAYAWSHNKSLNWGSGGPERWPGARPYLARENEQDQLGFRIFDWYLAICRQELGATRPIILFQAGAPGDGRPSAGISEPLYQAQTSVALSRLMSKEAVQCGHNPPTLLDPATDEILACVFDELCGSEAGAWFHAEGAPNPVARDMQAWVSQRKEARNAKQQRPVMDRPIRHYLLLPAYEWGISDWHLEVIRPFVKRHQATVGFSIDEAEQASFVTIVGNLQTFPESITERLMSAGCKVERISGDGTDIASLLAAR